MSDDSKPTIDPGEILISGSETLASWRTGSDATTISGGTIATNKISNGTLYVSGASIPLGQWVDSTDDSLVAAKNAAEAAQSSATKAYTTALNAELAAVQAQNEAVAAMAMATKVRDDANDGFAEFQRKGRNLLYVLVGAILFDVGIAAMFWSLHT